MVPLFRDGWSKGSIRSFSSGYLVLSSSIAHVVGHPSHFQKPETTLTVPPHWEHLVVSPTTGEHEVIIRILPYLTGLYRPAKQTKAGFSPSPGG